MLSKDRHDMLPRQLLTYFANWMEPGLLLTLFSSPAWTLIDAQQRRGSSSTGGWRRAILWPGSVRQRAGPGPGGGASTKRRRAGWPCFWLFHRGIFLDQHVAQGRETPIRFSLESQYLAGPSKELSIHRSCRVLLWKVLVIKHVEWSRPRSHEQGDAEGPRKDRIRTEAV